MPHSAYRKVCNTTVPTRRHVTSTIQTDRFGNNPSQSALATTGDDNRADVSGQFTECDGIAEANPTRRQRENAPGACLHRHDTGRLAALDLLEL